jgi:hypothetical protein
MGGPDKLPVFETALNIIIVKIARLFHQEIYLDKTG